MPEVEVPPAASGAHFGALREGTEPALQLAERGDASESCALQGLRSWRSAP
jgi:hypothetical protein